MSARAADDDRRGRSDFDSAVALDASSRARVREAVDRARAEGQTRWLACVREAAVDAALACYARVGQGDRFLWESGESEDFSVAWGVVHEIESAGPERFRDVRAFCERVRSRIDWVGDPRPRTAASFFGGFGFEAESRGAAEWKAFPAARFVLPEAIAEREAGRTRRVVFARIEPGASLASVEAELEARWASFAAPGGARRAGDPRAEAAQTTPGRCSDAARLPASRNDWPAGPEYRVRADRSHGIFRAQVEQALAAIERGSLTKVVLARALAIDHDGALDVVAFLERLRAIYPTCTLVAMGRGDDTFLAATPETLVRVRAGRVETAALAGSAPRGRTPQEDEALGRALLCDPKERAEHAHVVDAIRGVLAEACEGLEVPTAPVLRPLFGIQHLETPLRGTLKSASARPEGAALDVVGLVEALHPTPAVCGVPRGAAQAWLGRSEGLDRGWYAAPIGWLDGEGGGDFRVALRSALIRNGLGPTGESGASRALLFAGAGIVDGSDPEQELVETRIKLRALLAPLTEI